MSDPRPLTERLRSYRLDAVVSAVRDANGNQHQAAKALGVDPTTVGRVLRQNGYRVQRLASIVGDDR